MADTAFVDYATVVPAAWLNDVNDRVYKDVANVKNYGAIGDGITDDTNALTSAFAVGGSVLIPAGTYLCNTSSSPAFSFVAGSVIRGEGKGVTTLQMTTESLTYKSLFDLSAGNIELRDLSIVWTTPAGSAGIGCFDFGDGGNIVIDSISVDLGCVDSGGALNAPNHMFMINGDASNVIIKNSYFTKFKFGILKTNASTAVNSTWEFSGNTFEDFYSPALTFNTPSGNWDDVHVIDNTLKNQKGYLISAFEHMGGVAGGNGTGRFIFSRNILDGSGEGWHFEEGMEDLSITEEMITVSDTGIFFVDNDVGGSPLTPKRLVISDNHIVQTGTPIATPGDVRGINIVIDVSGYGSARQYVISNNIIEGYDKGITTDEDAAYGSIRGNYIKDCTIGIRTATANCDISGNTLESCATGISSATYGGLVGENNFISCTTPIDDTSGYIVGASGFSVTIHSVALASGNPVYINILPIGTRMYGTATFHLQSSGGASQRYAVFELTYDGTTLTATSKAAGGGGNILTPTFVNNSGNLALSMNNSTGSEQSCRVKVTFKGGYFVT